MAAKLQNVITRVGKHVPILKTLVRGIMFTTNSNRLGIINTKKNTSCLFPRT